MKIVLYTVGIDPGYERLMPWRTLIEVCKYLNSHSRFEAIVANGTDIIGSKDRIYDTVKIAHISKGLAALIKYCTENQTDVLYYPISFRDGLKSLSAFKSLTIKKIAYIPGGVYAIRGSMELLKIDGFNSAKPYLFENIVPKNLVLRKLKSAGFDTIITLSESIAKLINSKSFHGINSIVSIPGNDSFVLTTPDDAILERLKLKNVKFFLFSGAPAPIRGSIHLLKAFDELANEDKSVRLVMLMRKDVSSDYTSFEDAFCKIKNKGQIRIIRETITPNELKSIFNNAYAVILPFLLIPSEIPLTYFEVLSCGTPIITFKNGGTYDYVQSAVIGGKTGSISDLKRMMKNLWNDENLRHRLSASALKLMKDHPKWEDTGNKWLQAIEKY
jgi:phosphatidyl-myo-inositol dimannoside synthase